MTIPLVVRQLWLVTFVLAQTALAWVYPRTPDGRIDPNFESVHAMRDRLDLAYNYTPSLVNPELCRYVTEAECQDVDESMQLHAKTHKNYIQQRREQHNSQHQHRSLENNHNPKIGRIKVLVLMIRFPDHVNDRNLITRSTIEDIWKGEIYNWFEVNSQGLYSMDPVVIDWITTDKTEKAYANGELGKMGVYAGLQQAMWPALDELDNRPGWDWSEYDMDNDGKLDSVVFMHSGISAVVSTDADCFDQKQEDRIWPHAWANSINSWQSKDKSVTLNGYTVSSVYDGTCDNKGPLTTGLTCHEYCHTMELPDLYDSTNLAEAQGVGAWDIMSHPYGADNSGTPGLLSTWSKMQLGWIDPFLIAADGIFTANPAHDGNHSFKIDIKPSFGIMDEYLLIENRQKIGFEENLWGAGLLITHIDDFAKLQKDKGYPGQPGWPQNGNHYQVAVLPKDGNYDMEKNVNFGDATDLYNVGDSIGPGKDSTVFPNTDSYQMGFITESGVTINVLSQDGNDITFEVTGYGYTASPTVAPPDTPPPTDYPTKPPVTAYPTTSPNPTTSPVDGPATDDDDNGGGNGDSSNNAPTMAPVDPGSFSDRWVLSRAPGPTRAPFSLPEFPVERPLDNVVSQSSQSKSAASSNHVGLGTYALLSAGLYIAASLM